MRRSVLLAGVLAMAIAGLGLAQEHPKQPPAQAKAVEATVVGENICLACSLKQERGAAAQCDKYGHRHALKVTSATAAGKDAPEMKGWVLHYLENDDAQPLIKEHHYETLAVKGKVHAAERVLEVVKFEAAKKAEHPEHPKKPEHPEHPK